VIESIMMALAGGGLIGLAASGLLLFNGRVCGISGIVAELLPPQRSAELQRLSFIAGLLLGGVALVIFMPAAVQPPSGRSVLTLGVAGLLVGVGTSIGSGCTSGHGICGLARRSGRSLAATLTFMATGGLSATVYALLVGGGS
jgi:uncharacterized membrane protein YedE/YeeE